MDTVGISRLWGNDMKSRNKYKGNKYQRRMRIMVSLMIGVVGVFLTYLLHIIIQQNIIIIGIATEYLEENEWNSFINQVVSKDSVTAYELGCSALQQAGYQNNTYLLFLQSFISGGIIFMVILFACSAIFITLYLRQKEEQIQELQKVVDWINSEEMMFLEQVGAKYVPLEIIQAIEKRKEKSVRQHILEEERTESIVKYMENISHQLKTPLAVIRATCERVSMLYVETEERMSTCFMQVDKMTLLIRDFLQLGRFDCKKQKMKFEYAFARDIIETVVNALETIAVKKNLSLTVHGKEEIRWYCDIFWMEEVLGNILKNCVEHSENGEISVNYEYSNNTTQIIIRDCGVGLKEGLETKIFERYSAVNRINMEGSGLGLSIAQEVMKLHYGTITARNQSKEGVDGIEFRVSFPQLDADNIY